MKKYKSHSGGSVLPLFVAKSAAEISKIQYRANLTCRYSPNVSKVFAKLPKRKFDILDDQEKSKVDRCGCPESFDHTNSDGKMRFLSKNTDFNQPLAQKHISVPKYAPDSTFRASKRFAKIRNPVLQTLVDFSTAFCHGRAIYLDTNRSWTGFTEKIRMLLDSLLL